MKKIPIYKIFKFNTSRLKRNNYNINITYEQAVFNNEVVSVSESQVIRVINDIVGKDSVIDNGMFIKDYLSIVVDKKSHYKRIKNSGIVVNGKQYKRLLCGAGNARTSTVFMIRVDLYEPVFERLCCGIEPHGKEFVLAKWNAYFALNNSSTWVIDEPAKVVVVKDCLVKRNFNFSWFNKYDDITDKNVDVDDFNCFDGQGIIDVGYASKIATYNIGLDYLPSVFIIRNTFIKGSVCVMDINQFVREFVPDGKIIDLWGNEHSAYGIDMILTESQFKMWKHYDSWEHYCLLSELYGLGWGITRFSHKNDDDHVFTNYQFIQALDLNDEQIDEIIKPTVEWINDITGGDVDKSLLYLLGDGVNVEKMTDWPLKSLLYNHKLIEDVHIKNRIIRSLNKKIRQAYSGKLLLSGNFSFMLSDPYALLQHAFGLNVAGLLKSGEHYNKYWSRQGVDLVGACRSPLTWVSEVNNINLKVDNTTDDWYIYLGSCCTIYNIYDDDTYLHSGADFDGDLVFTTNNKTFIDGKNKKYNFAVKYEPQKADKSVWSELKLYDVDMMSFGTRIGFITNCSTYWYSLLPQYDVDSLEYAELINRLKATCAFQSMEIDKTKGIKTDEFPKGWYQNSIDNNEIERKLVANKKPYFQKYIYTSLNKEYMDYVSAKDLYSKTLYGLPLVENNDVAFVDNFKKYSPVVDTDSVMNKVCHRLESKIKEIKVERKKQNQNIVDNVLINYDREILLEYEGLIKELLSKYKSVNNTFKNTGDKFGGIEMKVIYEGLANIAKAQMKNPYDLANIVVYTCYGSKCMEDRQFVWDVFGAEVFANVKYNSGIVYHMPIESTEGDIVYMNKKYERRACI